MTTTDFSLADAVWARLQRFVPATMQLEAGVRMAEEGIEESDEEFRCGPPETWDAHGLNEARGASRSHAARSAWLGGLHRWGRLCPCIQASFCERARDPGPSARNAKSPRRNLDGGRHEGTPVLVTRTLLPRYVRLPPDLLSGHPSRVRRGESHC